MCLCIHVWVSGYGCVLKYLVLSLFIEILKYFVLSQWPEFSHNHFDAKNVEISRTETMITFSHIFLFIFHICKSVTDSPIQSNTKPAHVNY